MVIICIFVISLFYFPFHLWFYWANGISMLLFFSTKNSIYWSYIFFVSILFILIIYFCFFAVWFAIFLDPSDALISHFFDAFLISWCKQWLLWTLVLALVCCVPYVFWYIVIISICFQEFISFLISPMTHCSFRSILFSLQVFSYFL